MVAVPDVFAIGVRHGGRVVLGDARCRHVDNVFQVWICGQTESREPIEFRLSELRTRRECRRERGVQCEEARHALVCRAQGGRPFRSRAAGTVVPEDASPPRAANAVAR